jgi:hypothetical protein
MEAANEEDEELRVLGVRGADAGGVSSLTLRAKGAGYHRRWRKRRLRGMVSWGWRTEQGGSEATTTTWEWETAVRPARDERVEGQEEKVGCSGISSSKRIRKKTRKKKNGIVKMVGLDPWCGGCDVSFGAAVGGVQAHYLESVWKKLDARNIGPKPAQPNC